MQYRARRQLTDFGVQVQTEQGTFSAEISDVTEKGVRLHMPKGVYAFHPKITVFIQGRPYAATVVWQKNGEIGAKLAETLDPATMDSVSRKVHRHMPTRRHRFLIT